MTPVRNPREIRMKAFLKGLQVLAFAATPLLALSQTTPWPGKPIKAIVPFPAGAATDLVARQVLERVARQLGQPIVVENKPGAGGTIGEAAVAQAEPDGYTILVHSNSHTLTPWTYKNLPYDGKRDLRGVLPLAAVPMVVVTAPDSGIRNLPDLVRVAKARPGTINYSSSGSGGATHLGAERLRMAGGFEATHIPFKGSAEAIREVMAGRVTFHVAPLSLALPQVKADKLVALASASSRRTDHLPAIPTTVEAGLPNSSYDVWIGMFVPAKTPQPIVSRLAEETAKALRSPEVKERYVTMAMDEMPMTVAEFAAFLERDFELNRQLVQATGLQPN